MNIRDLKYLVALIDHGHFGKAAAACFVSQPALSMQIKKLETLLGIQLLERRNKSIILTESGILIAERARAILSQVEAVHDIAKASKDPFQGELHIGIFPTLAPYLLPLIMPALTKSFPKIAFYLIEERTHVLVEKLKQGQLHAALLATPIADTGFNHSLLFEEEFLLTVPKTHAFAKRKIISQRDLSDKELLLLDEGHCLRDQALAVCQQMRASEHQSFRATSLETLRHMVSAGIGITLLPKLACYRNKYLTYLPFTAPKPTRHIALFWRKSSHKQIVLEQLTIQIKQAIAKQKQIKQMK